MIDYLDYIYHDWKTADDQGIEQPRDDAFHFSFGGKVVRISDLPPLDHGCGEIPERKYHYWELVNPSRTIVEEHADYELHTCNHCGWWQARCIERLEPMLYNYQQAGRSYTGVARVFPSKARAVIDEVARLINTDNPQLSFIDPHLFEKALAEVFRHYYRASEVKHLGRSGDGGIDLYCVMDDETYLIQVERRMNGKVEEVVTVRELVGAYVLAPFEITTTKRSVHVITTAPRISMPELTPSSRERLATNQLTISGHAFEQAKEMLNLAAGRVAEPWLHIPFAREIRDRSQKKAQTSS